MTSPYAQVGSKLVDQGYSAIPVLPHSKRPGTRSRGQWYGDLDWTRFCDRLPTDIEVGVWERYPDDAGVCVALGKASGGLVAIDVDTDNHKVQEAIDSVLPPSPVQKAGRKGYTAFYRAREAVQSCAFNINGDRALDLLAHGKQTVLPPTIHPDTGKPYIWITASNLLDVSPDRLPMLPDDIAARLGDVLAPFGYYAPVERPPSDGDGGIWREVNDVALERFDAWVPHLGMDAKRRGENWRGCAVWRDSRDRNIGFSPQGIRDFAHDKGMTAIDVVMEAMSADFSTAEKWLREKLGFKEPPPVVFLLKPRERVPDPIVEHDPTPHYWPEAKCNPFDPAAAGGLLGQTAEWIYNTSPKPSRELSMLAALGIMSVFAGRRYAGPSELTAALYLIGVAPTGAGKNHPISCAKNLLLHTPGMAGYLGSGDYGSDSVMEKLVRQKPVHLAVLDEIGAWLQETTARHAKEYKKGRRKVMLEIYTNSQRGGIYLGKDTAGADQMSSSMPILSPSLSILGMSTDELFFKGLSEENMSDGLLARMTVVNIAAPPEEQDIVPVAMPPHVLRGAYMDALERWGPTGKLARQDVHNATALPAMQDVPYDSEEAKTASKAFKEWEKGVIAEDKSAVGYASRAHEQSLKIALIRAVSRDPTAPRINVDDLAFGRAFVVASIESLKAGLQKYMSGSDFEDGYKIVLRHVLAAGDEGITDTNLRRKPGVSKLEQRKYDGIVTFLTKYHMWEVKKGKRGNRYVHVEGREVAEDSA